MKPGKGRFHMYWYGMVISGILVFVGPLMALVKTSQGMTRAFDSMGTSGMSDPAGLSKHVDGMLVSTSVGIGVGVVAFAFFVLFLVLTILEIKRLSKPRTQPPGEMEK